MQVKKGVISNWIGVLAAASGIMAPSALAVGWCPSASDFTISCHSCSRELTCNVRNISLYITGHNVRLDGRGYSISNSPGPGIKVSGPESNLSNINIYDAGQGTSTTEGHGIFYTPFSAGGAVSKVYSAYIYHSKTHGIYNTSKGALEVHNSHLVDNGGSGFLGAGTDIWNDVYNTSSTANDAHGFTLLTGWSYAKGSSFNQNAAYGMYAYGALEGLQINRNYFYSNHRGLFLSGVRAPEVTYNSGSNNVAIDCYDANSSTGTHHWNNWGTYYGPNCKKD